MPPSQGSGLSPSNIGVYIMYGEKQDPMLYNSDISRRASGIELWATLKFLVRDGSIGVPTL